jgi:multicomponent Na+:H+ antiporter subunit D
VGLLLSGIALFRTVYQYGIQTTQVGNWPAPYGISLVADHFSALMVLVAGTIGTVVAIYSLADVDKPRQTYAFYPLLHVLLMGVTAAFLAGDVFNLFVWFEVILMASFVLLALGSEQKQLAGALKYVTLNLLSSFLFLAVVGMLYATVGTLNMADAARKLAALENQEFVTILALLFLAAFGVKAAIFPLFFWLPESYPTPPAAVSAVFAGLLTKVGVYALIRFFTLLFVGNVDFTHGLILVIAGLTMITGVLGAVAQSKVRHILSFHIISQIGYMILGLGLFTPLGIAGSVFYMIHHIIVKTTLFLVAGLIHQLRGVYALDELGGLYAEKPSLSIMFAVPALSLAGMPPLSGFVAKLSLVRAGIEAGQYAIVAAAILVGLLTLYSMTKIWTEAFWKSSPVRRGQERSKGDRKPGPLRRRDFWVMGGPICVLAALTITLGVATRPFFAMAEIIGSELLDTDAYIDAVLSP